MTTTKPSKQDTTRYIRKVCASCQSVFTIPYKPVHPKSDGKVIKVLCNSCNK